MIIIDYLHISFDNIYYSVSLSNHQTAICKLNYNKNQISFESIFNRGMIFRTIHGNTDLFFYEEGCLFRYNLKDRTFDNLGNHSPGMDTTLDFVNRQRTILVGRSNLLDYDDNIYVMTNLPDKGNFISDSTGLYLVGQSGKLYLYNTLNPKWEYLGLVSGSRPHTFLKGGDNKSNVLLLSEDEFTFYYYDLLKRTSQPTGWALPCLNGRLYYDEASDRLWYLKFDIKRITIYTMDNPLISKKWVKQLTLDCNAAKMNPIYSRVNHGFNKNF